LVAENGRNLKGFERTTFAFLPAGGLLTLDASFKNAQVPASRGRRPSLQHHASRLGRAGSTKSCFGELGKLLRGCRRRGVRIFQPAISSARVRRDRRASAPRGKSGHRRRTSWYTPVCVGVRSVEYCVRTVSHTPPKPGANTRSFTGTRRCTSMHIVVAASR